MEMKSRMLTLFCFLGCMVIQEITGHTLCPDNWVPFQGSCYMFAFDQKLPYTEAHHFCTQHSAYLAHVDNVHERNFLSSALTHLIPYPWWIGLNDQDIEGEYRWIDTDTAPKYTDWLGGSPRQGNVSTHNSDCVCLQPSQFHWVDTDCVAPFKPICERQGLNGDGAVG